MFCNHRGVWIAVVILIIIIVIIVFIAWWSRSGSDGSSHGSSHSPVTPVSTVGSGTTAIVMLSGSQEAPIPVTTSASGTGRVTLTADQTSINYEIMAMGLIIEPSIGAHFHRGAKGKAGPVVKNLNVVQMPGTSTSWMLNGSWSTMDDMQPLTPTDIADFLNGMLYVNLHSPAYRDGEIRGQVPS